MLPVAKAFNIVRSAGVFPAFSGVNGMIDHTQGSMTWSGKAVSEKSSLRVAAGTASAEAAPSSPSASAARRRVAASLACHAAVRAGQTLAPEEMRDLIEDRALFGVVARGVGVERRIERLDAVP